MAVFKIQLEDFSSSSYELIAIHTTLETSKLAYLLNKNLETLFSYFDNLEIIKQNEKATFERFLFENKENEDQWNLIENKSVIKGEKNKTSLFEQIDKTIYLIPEYKKVDYLLKIDTEENSFFINNIVQKISKIKFVSMSYLMDKEKIKIKNNLIF